MANHPRIPLKIIYRFRVIWSLWPSETSISRKSVTVLASTPNLNNSISSQTCFPLWTRFWIRQNPSWHLMSGVIIMFWSCRPRSLTVEWKTHCWPSQARRLSQKIRAKSMWQPMKSCTVGLAIWWPMKIGAASGWMKVLRSSMNAKPVRSFMAKILRWFRL